MWERQSFEYTNDDLGRLTNALRGIDLDSTPPADKPNFRQTWVLGQTGNWNSNDLDLNADGDLTDSGELDELNPLNGGSSHFNLANELLARDTDNGTSSADNYTLAYDEVGNMTDDGKDYEYVYDPFGRLRRIKNTSNQALVAEYWYNGLGHRITWHYDATRSGGGAPDGTVDTNDPKFHLFYNERWQHVATYRQANGSAIDTDPKEQFLNHNAGLAGYGSSSYIDAVILRDDHDATWTGAGDATLDRRVYFCQNWRADVVALLAPNGRLLERAWYEPYGTPHGSSNGDFSGTSDDTNDLYLVPDGDVDADDTFVYLDLDGVDDPLSDMTGDSDPGDPEYGRPNGVIDADDFFFFLDCASKADALGRNQLSAGHDGVSPTTQALRNRRGLAGYEFDPAVKRYHVRNRVLYPEIGRWTRRDPLGYVDGMGLYWALMCAPVLLNDHSGYSTCWHGGCPPGGGSSGMIDPPSWVPDPIYPDPITPFIPAPFNLVNCNYEATECLSRHLDDPVIRDQVTRFQDCAAASGENITITCADCENTNAPIYPRNKFMIEFCWDGSCDNFDRNTLRHEITHIRQKCEQGSGYYSNCRNAVCAEIEAYCNEVPGSCAPPRNGSQFCNNACQSAGDVCGDSPTSLESCTKRCQRMIAAGECQGGKHSPPNGSTYPRYGLPYILDGDGMADSFTRSIFNYGSTY